MGMGELLVVRARQRCRAVVLQQLWSRRWFGGMPWLALSVAAISRGADRGDELR
jgi:hypothetical protein